MDQQGVAKNIGIVGCSAAGAALDWYDFRAACHAADQPFPDSAARGSRRLI